MDLNTEVRQAFEAARAALEAAEKEHRTMLAQEEQARGLAGEKEESYDASPGDKTGADVLAARQAHELTKVRSSRAKVREDAARAVFNEAEELVRRIEASERAEADRASRAAARKLASVEHFRASIAPELDTITGALAALVGAIECVEQKYRDACAAAEAASTPEDPCPPIHSAHRFVHVLRALPSSGLPPELRHRLGLLASRVVAVSLGGSNSVHPSPARDHWLGEHSALESVATVLSWIHGKNGERVGEPYVHDIDPALAEQLAGVTNRTEGTTLREQYQASRALAGAHQIIN